MTWPQNVGNRISEDAPGRPYYYRDPFCKILDPPQKPPKVVCYSLPTL